MEEEEAVQLRGGRRDVWLQRQVAPEDLPALHTQGAGKLGRGAFGGAPRKLETVQGVECRRWGSQPDKQYNFTLTKKVGFFFPLSPQFSI